ncbi:transcriptional regulator containing an amidase domain and an AraC-type DNA-binding HTH domain [Mycolicibacterium flavescens]|uniref:GlxA family transcriptional regulator n=1 Tax=Mycobacterium neumannii TaxID=2048551 RepID=UPI000B945E15|nr:helix-turn-helix domain-containing protein [Mycobacterium neumannii]VEG40350.1 transcriptional regulator containing an amidase domain and an AraC-type DNA-binding HTH domain [Mycolicibacterium flavescens]
MHTVAVVALPNTIAFDLATAVEVFDRVRLPSGEPGYRVMVCATAPVVTAGPLAIASDRGIADLRRADTIVVPGCDDLDTPPPDELVDALRSAHRRGARIASICTGAFTLAEAGLLDGRRATTHWVAADLFRARYPDVHLDPDVLYVDEGDILSSAGASAGLDLCLHMVALDHGSAMAADAARMAVAPLHRSGGQAQFIVRNRPAVNSIAEQTTLDDLLAWLEHNAHRDLTLHDLAAQAALSVRTLNRRFQAETGQTPMQWLTGVRIRHAQQLLESTDHGVERIGREVGFTSAANFREQFRRLTGVSPQSYRNTFRDRIAG